jgi:hypothetical protein
MKKIVLILGLFCSTFVYSQYKIVEETKYDSNLKTDYSSIMYIKQKVIDPVLYLYVFIDVYNQNNIRKEIKKIISKNKLKNSTFYFVKIPSNCKDDKEKAHFFLNFMCTILGEKKMIDSDLIILSNNNITSEYESERLKKAEFEKNALEKNLKGSNFCKNYLNEVNRLIINPNVNEINKILVKS